MEEEKKIKYLTKETLIAAGIGLLIGVITMLLIALALSYFAKSAGIARLKYGEETLATINGKNISTQTLYDKMKNNSGFNTLLNEVDITILRDKYTLTDAEKDKIKKDIQSQLDYIKTLNYSEQYLYDYYNCKDYDDLLEYFEVNTCSSKYLYDYLEAKLETGAVQKYYDENKSEVETYDSEHILVQITDTVTDEQALALANEIIEKLNSGKTFDEVVTEYGDRIVHENLGYQGKTASLEQAYIDELVALNDGEYSKTPIKTSYGYHIVHRLATATLEELRGTIIEKLSADLLANDANLTEKAYVELRKENNFAIYDEELKKQYEEYCDKLYNNSEVTI